MTGAKETAINRVAAFSRDRARAEKGRAGSDKNIAGILMRLEANDAAIVTKVRADATGDPFDGVVLSPAEIENLNAELAASRQARLFFEAQLAGINSELDRAESELRDVIGRHVRAEIVPPLLETAKRSFGAAMKDLARLAAAEDWSIRLQAKQSTDYVPGNASQFITGMLRGTARNVYFDAGPGRGAWDVPGYAEQSALVETAVRTMEAGE